MTTVHACGIEAWESRGETGRFWRSSSYRNEQAFLDDGTMAKGNDNRDLVLVHLDVLLRMGTARFGVLSPDGTLQTRCDKLLQRMCPDQFRIVGPSSIPTNGESGRLNLSIDSETGVTERPYQVLPQFMGLLSWP